MIIPSTRSTSLNRFLQLWLLGFLLFNAAVAFEIAVNQPKDTPCHGENALNMSCKRLPDSQHAAMMREISEQFPEQHLGFLNHDKDECDCPVLDNVAKASKKQRPGLQKDSDSLSGWLGGSRGSGLAFQRRKEATSTTTKWQSMLNDSFVMMFHVARYLALE
jgi:hypothetical protein